MSENSKLQSADVLVCVHGYTQQDPTTHHSQEQVFQDRIECALEVVQSFNSNTEHLNLLIVFLGQGRPNENTTNAQLLSQYATTHYSQQFEDQPYILLDEDGGNTRQEIELVCETTSDYRIPIIISVSNRDHTPRINRTWSECKDDFEIDSTVLVANSQNNYSKFDSIDQSSNPFILEAASFEPFIRVLDDNLWSIPKEEYAEVVSELEEVLQKYQK